MYKRAIIVFIECNEIKFVYSNCARYTDATRTESMGIPFVIIIANNKIAEWKQSRLYPCTLHMESCVRRIYTPTGANAIEININII